METWGRGMVLRCNLISSGFTLISASVILRQETHLQWKFCFNFFPKEFINLSWLSKTNCSRADLFFPLNLKLKYGEMRYIKNNFQIFLSNLKILFHDLKMSSRKYQRKRRKCSNCCIVLAVLKLLFTTFVSCSLCLWMCAWTGERQVESALYSSDWKSAIKMRAIYHFLHK